MPPASGHSFVVACHAIDALTRFRKNEFLYAAGARTTTETSCVIGFLASHDGLVGDGFFADIAIVRAIAADGTTIGQQEQVGVRCCNSISALCTFEAIYMPQRVSKSDDDSTRIGIQCLVAASAMSVWVRVLGRIH
jgi:hypothetical protein